MSLMNSSVTKQMNKQITEQTNEFLMKCFSKAYFQTETNSR